MVWQAFHAMAAKGVMFLPSLALCVAPIDALRAGLSTHPDVDSQASDAIRPQVSRVSTATSTIQLLQDWEPKPQTFASEGGRVGSTATFMSGRNQGRSATRIAVHLGDFSTDVFELEDLPISFKHNAKTGGSFVKGVLHELLGSQVEIVPEFTPAHGVGSMNTTSAFTIGNIREPCSTYLSLWKYCVLGMRMGRGGAICNDEQLAKFITNVSTNDADTFRKFVKTLVSQDDEVGLVTARTSYNYVSGRHSIGHADELLVKTDGALLKKEWYDRNVTASVDCWVHTESMESDLRGCLERFEKERGLPAHLERYDEVVGNMRRNSFDELVKMAGWPGETRHTCSEYFDGSTRKHVEEHDSLVFETFHYPSCCAERAAPG